MKSLLLSAGLILAGAGPIHGAPIPTAKEYVSSIGMKFVRIEPGTFQMGAGNLPLPRKLNYPTERSGSREFYVPTENGDFDERPAHKVTISRPFYMSITEVTNEQYEKFDPLHVYLRGKLGFSIDNDEAVVFVTWHEANAFFRWLSQKEGLPYRLPTEAEWEFACRAGTSTHFHSGDALPDCYLKNPDNSWYPDPGRGRGRQEVVPLNVGKTPANAWGLYDMHGNVEEWCCDWYGSYEANDQTDPVGRADGDFRVTRGGSHSTFAYYLRSANRMGALPQDRSWLIGLRVVIGDMPQTEPLPPAPRALYQHNVTQKVPADLSQGPDPKEPYFRGPDNFVRISADSSGPLFSKHNHNAAIVECPNGDLLATWFTTWSERGREMALAASRLPYGQQEWQPASPFWDAPDRNDPAHALWYDGKGTIYHFSSISVAATWGPLAVVMRTSQDNGVTWSKARIIIPEYGRRHQVVESVFRTEEGYLVLPCDATPGGGGGTALQISRDGGLSWADAGGTIAGIHAAAVQLADRRLLAFGRGDTIEGKMPQSVSSDMGRTWTYSPSIFPPIGGGQRLVLLRLREGPLFLASFANEESMMITDSSAAKRLVRGLFGAVSYDDGRTWPKIRLISDEGPARQARTTNGGIFTASDNNAEPRGYLSVCQAVNGLIHLASSWNHYAFNLKWLVTPPPPVQQKRTSDKS